MSGRPERSPEHREEQAEGISVDQTDLPADARNRPTSLAGQPLTWDANGNLTAKGDLRLAYDFRNRLTEVRQPDGTLIASYTHDPFNRRVRRTAEGSTHTTAWSGYREIEEATDGQLTQRRIYGRGLDEIARLELDL